MKMTFSILIVGALCALMATAPALTPSDALNANRDPVSNITTRTVIDPNDPNYVWGNPNAVLLTNLNPSIFDSPAFLMTPGGLMSDMYTSSINEFRAADPNAGASNATRKGAVIGLIHWPGKGVSDYI